MNLDPKTHLVFASQHALAHVATGLVLASGVLTAAVALAGCSDSPPSGCAPTGTCALPDARDAQTPADGFAEAADASDAASPDGGVADDGPTPDGGAADGPTPMPDGGVADGLAPDGGDALDANPCDPSRDPKDQPCLVTSAYGVFVAASGRNGASGDKTDPAISIAQGIATAAATGKSRVFICQGSYAETVVLDAAHDGISLYGGFDCINGWTWTGAATAVASPVGAPYALYVFSTTRPVAIEDLRFTSADASGQSPSGSGNSSIAAFFFASTARLARVALIAGRATDGAPGNPGVDTPNYPPALPIEAPGSAAYYALVDNDSTFDTAPGGSVNNACADSSSSTGGAGGAGDSYPVSYPGAAGSASPPPASPKVPFDGAGGVNIGPGDPGADGAAHQAPVAAATYGSLSAAGWQALAGADGPDGDPGQGGGGGGGNWFAYAGNGGGAGGCGGAGGKGGAGGGASIALLSVGSTLTLAACTLTTARAGDGGAGGDAQDGQGGGAGGATVNSALGGSGGNGAGGSGGSGGAAGISVGIAYQGVQPAIDAMTTITLGAPGLPGSPGAPGAHGIGALPTGNDGASGTQGVPGFAAPVISL